MHWNFSSLARQIPAAAPNHRAWASRQKHRHRGKGYRYERLPPTIVSGLVEKMHGTALAVFEWVSYIHPVLGETTVELAER
ncbi:hypothetical protein [Sorangium sp. So ce1153]|uniref:Uncharacterized protein n=1 Tax=Sorangium cellulosum TaxID=56 RepID=A0A150R0D5_SORCE|nr:hypothetical protein BE17_16435 [Sorangium cellulosum]